MDITGHKTEAVYRRYHIVTERDVLDAGRRMEQFFGESRKVLRRVEGDEVLYCVVISLTYRDMVGVAQLVERWIVVPVAEGSNPSTHPR
jgi:hypothetical protein